MNSSRNRLMWAIMVLVAAGCASTSTTASTTAPATTVAAVSTVASAPATAALTTSLAVTTTVVAATTTTVPAAWVPVPPGKYNVGVETITMADPAGIRPLTVDVWFPLKASIEKSALNKQRYSLLPEVYYESPGAFAARSEQISTDEKFPLIVYSHGSGGLRYIHSSYTEALASHGYIVVAPDHTGNTATERITNTGAPPAQTAFDRPTDVRRVIDAFLDGGHPTAGAFAEHVNPDKVVVTGHSLGGFTSIASVTGFTNEVGTVAPDPRVKAIVPMAPASAFFPDEAFAGLKVPMMVLVGTDDKTTPVDPNVTSLWDRSKNSPAYRVELVAAEHQTFTDLCAYKTFLPTLANVPPVITDTINTMSVDGCSAGDMLPARAAEITNSYVVRFLDQVLRGGPLVGSVAPADVKATSR